MVDTEYGETAYAVLLANQDPNHLLVVALVDYFSVSAVGFRHPRLITRGQVGPN